MRFRFLSVLTIGLLVCIASLPAFNAHAGGTTFNRGVVQATPAATQSDTPKCSDPKILKMVGDDAKVITDDLTKMSKTSSAADVYAFMTKISDIRTKYEDMEDPTDDGCSYLVYETMVWFANLGDLGVVLMGSQLSLDKDNIGKRADKVLARVQAQTKNVTDLIAVPAK